MLHAAASSQSTLSSKIHRSMQLTKKATLTLQSDSITASNPSLYMQLVVVRVGISQSISIQLRKLRVHVYLSLKWIPGLFYASTSTILHAFLLETPGWKLVGTCAIEISVLAVCGGNSLRRNCCWNCYGCAVRTCSGCRTKNSNLGFAIVNPIVELVEKLGSVFWYGSGVYFGIRAFISWVALIVIEKEFTKRLNTKCDSVCFADGSLPEQRDSPFWI